MSLKIVNKLNYKFFPQKRRLLTLLVNSFLNDSNFKNFFEQLQLNIQNGICSQLDDTINIRIASEFQKHLDINRELSSDQIENYKIKMAETYNKILRKENNILIMKTHLNNQTAPTELSYNRFPNPFLHHDQLFVQKYNNLIRKFQQDLINLIIERCNEQIEILKNDFKLFSNILKNHISKLDDYEKYLKENEKKKLEKDFEKANKKCLEIITKPFITKEKTKNKQNDSYNKTKFENSRISHVNSNINNPKKRFNNYYNNNTVNSNFKLKPKRFFKNKLSNFHSSNFNNLTNKFKNKYQRQWRNRKTHHRENDSNNRTNFNSNNYSDRTNNHSNYSDHLNNYSNSINLQSNSNKQKNGRNPNNNQQYYLKNLNNLQFNDNFLANRQSQNEKN
jgi:hypothetical protein